MLSSKAILALPAAVTIAMGFGSNAISDNQASPPNAGGAGSTDEPIPAAQPRGQMTCQNSITGSLSRDAMQNLSRLYEIANADVFWFLNEQIAHLLINTESVIREYFEPTKIALELRSDPESGSDVLLVSIHTSMDWQQSDERLEQFDRNWWLTKSWVPSNKRICVDVRA